jgi:ribonucleoside-diphosphate reductase beta chain
MEVLNKNIINNIKSNMFFGPNLGIQRYDIVKYKLFSRLLKQQKGFFWQPEEVDLTRDKNDFRSLTENEKHIFTSNLKRQIVLDSVQGRAPSLAFLPICSLPELEAWIVWWTASEQVHSDSYTHIIRNVYHDPSKIFDEIMNIEEIVNCAKDISVYYDDLIEYTNNFYVEKTHKKKLWLALNAVNALEGVRFYVSFACSWAFAELKKMEGNAKIIKLIAADENLHLAGTQAILKLLPKEDDDFKQIEKECYNEVVNIFESVVNQEKQWADYLFKDGSIIGLNSTLLKNYIEYIANTRMETIGYGKPYPNKKNNLPWTISWISGKNVQVTPQESEIESYLIGDTKMDVTRETFEGFKL